MMTSWTRRQFLAAATAGPALATFSGEGRTTLCSSMPGIPPQLRPGADGETPLHLPSTVGGAGVRFANTPNWAREAPALFVPDTLSAGSGLLHFPHSVLLRDQIKSFHDLPALVEQAQSIGTNIVYLVDWYEGGWTKKGDYLPDPEFGGEPAFRQGLAAAHRAGGRIILYVEGLIAEKSTNIARQHGAEWSIIGKNNQPIENPFPGNWKMCPATAGWASHLEDVSRRVAAYGADGIYWDDWGDPEEYACHSSAHHHPIGQTQVYDNGQIAIARRVRAALEAGRPDGAIMVTEGNFRQPLFEFVDGSLSWSMSYFMTRWAWNSQGGTDTFVPCFSLDDWNQAVAVGAKLACPLQFLSPPPGQSAVAFLDGELAKWNPERGKVITPSIVWGLNKWRNAGLILGLRVPGLGDIGAFPLAMGGEAPRDFLEELRPRAAAIDSALDRRQAPAATAYLKALLTARGSLARLIDHGSSVEQVGPRQNPAAGHVPPGAAAWRFTGANGIALTTVNVADEPCQVAFPNVSGTWRDAVTGEEFVARGGTLTVSVPAHRARLLHSS